MTPTDSLKLSWVERASITISFIHIVVDSSNNVTFSVLPSSENITIKLILNPINIYLFINTVCLGTLYWDFLLWSSFIIKILTFLILLRDERIFLFGTTCFSFYSANSLSVARVAGFLSVALLSSDEMTTVKFSSLNSV